HAEAEPLKLGNRALRRLGPDHVLQNVARLRALHGDVVQLVGRGAHPSLVALLLGLLAEPDAGIIITADPAEIVLAQAEGGAIVDHAAVLVAHGGIDNATGR